MPPPYFLYDFDELSGLIEFEWLLPLRIPAFPIKGNLLEFSSVRDAELIDANSGLGAGLGSKKERF